MNGDGSELIQRGEKLPVAERLRTSEGAKEYAKEKIRASFARLEQEKGLDWFVVQTPEGEKNVREKAEIMLLQAVDEYNEICRKEGGTLVGENTYLPLDNSVPAHNERHSDIQTALAADVATEIALSDQTDLPQGIEGEFSFSDWMNLTTTALLHESGYMRVKMDLEMDRLPCVYLAGIHEDFGKDFAEQFIRDKNLASVGVSMESVKDGIEGTKMARSPKRLDKWSDITLADLSHFIDLASYAVDPKQVPEGMIGLWEEIQFSEGGKAKFPGDRVSWIASQFMKPKGNNFGQEVKDLMGKLHKDSPWLEIYENNQERLQNYEDCKQATKAGDTRLVETSVDPESLWRRAGEYALPDIYMEGVPKLIDQRSGDEIHVSFKLPTWMYRRIYQNTPEGLKHRFFEDTFSQILSKMEEQGTNAEGMRVQFTPMAVEDNVDEETVTMRDFSLYVDSFKKAKEEAGVEGARLEVMLRRGDGAMVNEKIVEAARDQGIDSFVLGGFEPLSEGDYELIDKIHEEREVVEDGGKKMVKGHVGIIWAQADASEYAEQGQRISEEWKRIEPLLKEGDRIVFPTALLLDYEDLEKSLWAAAGRGVEVELSVSGALDTGYKIEDVVGFIRKCQVKGNLRLVSGNSSVWNEVTTDVFKLLADGGMSRDELAELGINFAS